jgi:hypothetical protein
MPFLTVKEAALRTGKSPSSIRRVIYPILKDDQHPDRSHVEPSPDDALKLRLKGENFAWKIDEDLLARAVPVDPAADKGTASSATRDAPDAGGELLAMLRRELDIKNQQITQQSEMLSRQMGLIDGLSERLREGNMLIGSLQQRLALTDGRTPAQAPVVDAKSADTPPVKKGSPAANKVVKPKRKSFLGRLFR